MKTSILLVLFLSYYCLPAQTPDSNGLNHNMISNYDKELHKPSNEYDPDPRKYDYCNESKLNKSTNIVFKLLKSYVGRIEIDGRMFRVEEWYSPSYKPLKDDPSFRYKSYTHYNKPRYYSYLTSDFDVSAYNKSRKNICRENFGFTAKVMSPLLINKIITKHFNFIYIQFKSIDIRKKNGTYYIQLETDSTIYKLHLVSFYGVNTYEDDDDSLAKLYRHLRILTYDSKIVNKNL